MTIQYKVELLLARYKLEEIDLNKAVEGLKTLFKKEIIEAYNAGVEINEHTYNWLRANRKITSLDEYLKLKQL